MRVFGALAIVLLYSCTRSPERPASVPKEAVWTSGADGGVWIDCGMSTKEPLTTFRCSVFHANGAPWIRDGSFALAERFIPSLNGSQFASAQCRTALTRAAVGAIVKSARINTIVYGFHVESA